jgi:hypothetical protein
MFGEGWPLSSGQELDFEVSGVGGKLGGQGAPLKS